MHWNDSATLPVILIIAVPLILIGGAHLLDHHTEFGRRLNRKSRLRHQGLSFWEENRKIAYTTTSNLETDSDIAPRAPRSFYSPQSAENNYIKRLEENIEEIVRTTHSDEEAKAKLKSILAEAEFIEVVVSWVEDVGGPASVDSLAFHNYQTTTHTFRVPQLKPVRVTPNTGST